MSIEERLDKIIKNEMVDRHSFFQLKYFVVGKEPTMQSKLWRCVNEYKSRKEAIDALKLEIAEVNDQAELLDIEKERLETQEKFSCPLDAKEQEIKLRQLNRKKESNRNALQKLEDNLKNTEEEATFFLRAFESLEEKEKIKPFDDEGAQIEFWDKSLREQFNLRLMLRKPMDLELIQTILALDDKAEIKKELTAVLEQELEKEEQAKQNYLKQQQNLERKDG